MKKLTMIGLSLLALAVVGCSNSSNPNNNALATNPLYNQCIAQGQNPTLCQQQYAGLTGTGTPQVCYGTYYLYTRTGQWMVGQCYGVGTCPSIYGTYYTQAMQPVLCE